MLEKFDKFVFEMVQNIYSGDKVPWIGKDEIWPKKADLIYSSFVGLLVLLDQYHRHENEKLFDRANKIIKSLEFYDDELFDSKAFINKFPKALSSWRGAENLIFDEEFNMGLFVQFNSPSFAAERAPELILCQLYTLGRVYFLFNTKYTHKPAQFGSWMDFIALNLTSMAHRFEIGLFQRAEDFQKTIHINPDKIRTAKINHSKLIQLYIRKSRDKHFAALSIKRQAEFLMEELKASGIEYGVDNVRLRLGEWKKGKLTNIELDEPNP